MNREQIRTRTLIYPGDVVSLPRSCRAARSFALPRDRAALADDARVVARPPGHPEHPAERPRAVSHAAAGHRGVRPLRRGADPARAQRRARARRGRRRVRARHRPEGGRLLVHLSPGRRRGQPRRHRVLGYESKFLGTARVENSASSPPCASSRRPRRSRSATACCRRRAETLVNYVPHAPEKPVNARILRVPLRRAPRRRAAASSPSTRGARRHRGRARARDLPRDHADRGPAAVAAADGDPALPRSDHGVHAAQSAWHRPTSAPACCSCSARSIACRSGSCSTRRIPFGRATTRGRQRPQHRPPCPKCSLAPLARVEVRAPPPDACAVRVIAIG